MTAKLLADRWRILPIIVAILGADLVIRAVLRLFPLMPYLVDLPVNAILLSLVAGPVVWRIAVTQFARHADLERLRADVRVTSALATVVDGVITTDAHGIVLYFNPGAERIFGYSAGEIVSQNIGILLPERFRKSHATQLGRFADGPESGRAMGTRRTIEGRRKGGASFPAEVSISKLTVDGQVTLMAIVRDVTEKRQAETALRTAELRLQAVVNSAPITIWATDMAGVFTLHDGAALKRVGMKPGDNVGASAFELFGALPFTTSDGNPATGGELLSRALRGEQVVGIAEVGGVVFETRIAPQLDAGGAIVGAVGVATDITDQRNAQEALRRSEAQFRAIFAKSPIGIAIRDMMTGRLVALNDEYAAMLGRTSDELRDLDWESVTDPDDVRRDLPRLAEIPSGSVTALEKRYLRPDGSVVWAKLRVVVLPVADDARQHLLVMAVDITERKRADEERRQSHERLLYLSSRLLEIQESERRQFARELHDEIGQTLSAIKINLQSMERFPDPAMLAVRLSDSVNVVERALGQVRALSLSLRPPLLDDLGLSAALRWLIDESGRRTGVSTEFRTAVPAERFDPAIEIACFRVAQEAVNNVAKHAGASHTSVELVVEGDMLRVNVSDDGRGFDVADARRRAVEGGSLGIIGMEERTTLAGGRIEWHSEPGHHTRVSAWFPISGRKPRPSSRG